MFFYIIKFEQYLDWYKMEWNVLDNFITRSKHKMLTKFI